MNHIHMQAELQRQRKEALEQVTIINKSRQYGRTADSSNRMGAGVPRRGEVRPERPDIHGLEDNPARVPEPESFHYESNRWGDHIVVHTNEGGIDHLYFDSKEEAESFIAKQRKR